MSDVASRFPTGGWQFDKAVVDEFDHHVRDNVPHYEIFQETVAHLSDWLAPHGANVVDLGAATGETIKAIGVRHPDRAYHFTAYDIEQEMLNAAQAKHREGRWWHDHRFTYVALDLTRGPLIHENADLTLALFTLQFLAPHQRAGVLRTALQLARPGGALIVAEKVNQPSAFWQEIANEATWDYKREQGVSADAIRDKARALRGVLIPLDACDVERTITDAGWCDPVCIWRWHQWGLWAATAPRA